MKTISFDAYITILIASLLIDFGRLLLSFILNDNRLSREKRIDGILLATGIYGLIAIIATYLYMGDKFYNKVAEFLNSVVEFLKPASVFIKENILDPFGISFIFIKENIANHWYNLFLPWINNNMENSFFDSILLIVFWSISAILTVGLAILCVLCLVVDFWDFNRPFISIVICIALIIFAPIILFYLFNTVYLLSHCSIIITTIVMVILTGISLIALLFLVFS